MTQFSVEKRHQAKGKGCVVVESFQECQQENEFSKANVTSLINSYPLKLMIPSHASENNSIWVYPVTFGGGLVGGDGIEMTFHVKPHCCAVITGQESTKVYHCEDALTTKQTTRGTVEDHALLCVMSDPVVCYRNSTFSQKQVLGSCIIIGKQMETIATKLNTRFGKKKSIGEKYDQEIVVSVSPLRYSVAMETVPGVYIRFMAVSSSKAYKSVVSVIAEN
ncbi:URED-like protein [Mya arenaria]|uniref:URED-like protein n=1 Tax=Mya arenaria TaxID=6604 RepID=A0ABY7EYG9_MYAAR|nr:URED-like protein [Mya arenaria]